MECTEPRTLFNTFQQIQWSFGSNDSALHVNESHKRKMSDHGKHTQKKIATFRFSLYCTTLLILLLGGRQTDYWTTFAQLLFSLFQNPNPFKSWSNQRLMTTLWNQCKGNLHWQSSNPPSFIVWESIWSSSLPIIVIIIVIVTGMAKSLFRSSSLLLPVFPSCNS